MVPAKCHPDRKHEAHGLCKSCYDVKRVGGTPGVGRGVRPKKSKPPKKKKLERYGEILEEELDFQGMTWDRVEKEFDRTRDRLRKALHRRDRVDLIERTDLLTYGEKAQRGRRPGT